jgi:hypothetical protein
LRAQIARINASTTLSAGPLHRFVPESTREIEDNAPEEGEVVKPTTQEMCDTSKWVHLTPSILR